MHDKTIIASHYVLNDILLTLESGELEDLRRVCQKYVSRYDNDDELIRVCSMVDSSKVGRKTIEDMRCMIEDLIDTRRLESSGGTDLWFSDRRKVK
jgi:hypothetical protein